VRGADPGLRSTIRGEKRSTEKWRVKYNTRQPHSALGSAQSSLTVYGCDINSLTRRGTKTRCGQYRTTVCCDDRSSKAGRGAKVPRGVSSIIISLRSAIAFVG
jgi:hypothetical protein